MKTFGKRGTFWSASLVLALSLWASGAPSVLYPVYATEWHLPPVVTTSVFGVYPLALLIVLLFFGSLSDTIGRRRAILIGVVLIAASALVFALAPNVGFLYLGACCRGWARDSRSGPRAPPSSRTTSRAIRASRAR